MTLGLLYFSSRKGDVGPTLFFFFLDLVPFVVHFTKTTPHGSDRKLATRKARQTFVFTATLNKDLRFDLKKKKYKQKKVEANAETGTMGMISMFLYIFV